MKPSAVFLCFLTILSLNMVTKAAYLVCYYPNWRIYAQGNAKYDTSNVNASLCTHYMYAFASLNPTTFTIKEQDPWGDISLKNYANFVALKNKNPSAKFLISLGGASDSNDGKYSTLVSSSTRINIFVSSVIAFLKLYKFDGLDLDWEQPSTPSDKAGYSNLIIALKTAFKPSGYLLTAAVPAAAERVDAGYDVPILNQYLDLLNIMTYDFHGSWENNFANHHSPLKKLSTDMSLWNSDYCVSYWISKGMSPSKITMGIPIYGRSWTLTSNVTIPPAPANGAGAQGPQIGERGFLAYYEICNYIFNSGWKVTQEPTYSIGPYAVSPSSPKTWVGYDDPAMARIKANYILSKGLGGGMVWEISTDDFRGTCNGGVNPVLSTLSSILVSSSRATTTSTAKSASSKPTTSRSSTSSKLSSSTSSKATTPKQKSPTTVRTSRPSITATARSITTGSTSKPTTSNRGSSSSKPTASVTTSKPTTRATSTIRSRTTTKPKPFVCPSATGLYPDPVSCSTYYSCAFGIAYKMNCPAGLYFNPTRSYCDFPSNVNCIITG